MSWNDRLKDAAYNSPGGNRIIFDYEDLSKAFDKNGTAFNFSDADGTYVQQTNNTSRRYPIRVIFWGDDHDLNAATFDSMLSEKGIGKLEHPLHGVIDVVPFGTITQRDDLKTAANQTIIDVIFWETIGLIYPSSQSDPGSEVLSAIDSFNNTASQEFEDNIDINTAIERVSLKNFYNDSIDNVKNTLQSIADVENSVSKEFTNVYDSINRGIDVLISQPLTLAFQTTILLQSPARALSNIQARLDAYENLSNSIISNDSDSVSSNSDSRIANQFYASNLFASTSVTGSIVSAINNQFDTKTQAIKAAEHILNQFDSIVEWRDNNFEILNEIDQGESYQQLQKSVALISGFLVNISFSLKQERRLVIDRNRTIIDLVAELYGSIDDKLDFFITSNDLTGSEILELSAGREIVYYI